MDINIQNHKVKYSKQQKLFVSSSKDVAFGTKHALINNDTGNRVEFDFTHSTGSEWDNNTLWVYVSECKEFTLHLLNDDVTEAHKQSYLNRKIANCG